MKIFIYGISASGKSTLARCLKQHLNYPLLDGDWLRFDYYKKTEKGKQDPFSNVSTMDSWSVFGTVSKENVAKGLSAIRASMAEVDRKEVSLYQDLIFEGVHIDPIEASKHGLVVFMRIDDEQVLEERMQQRLDEGDSDYKSMGEILSSAFMQQDIFAKEAEQIGALVIDGLISAEDAVAIIQSHIDTHGSLTP